MQCLRIKATVRVTHARGMFLPFGRLCICVINAVVFALFGVVKGDVLKVLPRVDELLPCMDSSDFRHDLNESLLR